MSKSWRIKYRSWADMKDADNPVPDYATPTMQRVPSHRLFAFHNLVPNEGIGKSTRYPQMFGKDMDMTGWPSQLRRMIAAKTLHIGVTSSGSVANCDNWQMSSPCALRS